MLIFLLLCFQWAWPWCSVAMDPICLHCLASLFCHAQIWRAVSTQKRRVFIMRRSRATCRSAGFVYLMLKHFSFYVTFFSKPKSKCAVRCRSVCRSLSFVYLKMRFSSEQIVKSFFGLLWFVIARAPALEPPPVQARWTGTARMHLIWTLLKWELESWSGSP